MPEVAIRVDPVTLGVVAGTLASTVKEMTVILQRTARSPVLAIGNDFSNAVYTTVNGEPEMVVQGQDQPVHLGGMLVAVKSAAASYGDDLSPGDVIVRNEPESGGSHLPDIDVIEPVFVEDRLVGFACSRAHMGDIGGSVPSGFNPKAEDLFSEGLVLPPIKLIERGIVREDLWKLILANVRTPQLMRGDMGAQISAAHVAVRRLRGLYEKYGVETVQAAMRELLDRAERLMRAQIAAIPDGLYEGSAWIEEDGHGAPAAEIRCQLEVAGEELRIRLEGPPACRSYRNSYWGATAGAVYLAVITAIEPGLPINEGLYRPLSLDLGPKGTMLNAERPAACSLSTANPWENVFEAVCDALSKAVPERACSGWAHVSCSAVSGVDPRYGEPYGGLMHVTYHGGAGAVHGVDGGPLWGSIVAAGAPRVGDVELLELRLPLHFHRYELARDSACPGTWRGGLGAVLEMEIVDHEAVVTHFGDGTRFPPPSRLGGGSVRDAGERVHRKFLLRADGRREALPLHAVETAGPGDRLLVLTPGGGGVGPAFERPPAKVAEDVRAGFVSLESAREEYGVVLDPDTLAVEERATAARRADR